MKYYLNDVEVSEADYKAAMKAHDAESTNTYRTVSPVNYVEPKVKKTKSKKVAKAPVTVLTPEKAAALNAVTIESMADKPKKGSKTAAAANIIRTIGADNKDACIKAIMEDFNTSKANASCYFFNVMKKGL